jgi:hypothetical protein
MMFYKYVWYRVGIVTMIAILNIVYSRDWQTVTLEPNLVYLIGIIFKLSMFLVSLVGYKPFKE